MNEIQRIHPGPRMSRVVIYNGMVFIGGQTAGDPAQDIAGQTRQVLAKIDGYLADAGIDKTRLLSAQVWLKDIAASLTPGQVVTYVSRLGISQAF